MNVFGFLRHIRSQRNFLVQTEEQYIFLHDALVEAIVSCETNIGINTIAMLANDDEFLCDQFKLITSFQPKEIHMTSAQKQVNSVKNRSTIIPLEGSRAHLTPKPGVDGSDYINASWLFGFRRLRDFIVTQHPLSNTIKDFWQMILDHSVQTIVLLSTVDEVVSCIKICLTVSSLLNKLLIIYFSLFFNSGQMKMKQLRMNIIALKWRLMTVWMMNSLTMLSKDLEYNQSKMIMKWKCVCCTIRAGQI